jgi:hypothetical protein
MIATNRMQRRLAPAVLAGLAWFGVLLQLWLSIRMAIGNGGSIVSGLVAYLGYFTVLTNVFVAIVATAGAVRPATVLYRPALVGCVTTAILVVGLVYHGLLREIWEPQGAQWVADIVLHYAVPIGALVHWRMYAMQPAVGWLAPFQWCWYPLAYFVYVILRGELIHAYPYPFIDVTVLGYARTLAHSLGLLAGFVLVGCVVVALARFRSGKSLPPQASGS